MFPLFESEAEWGRTASIAKSWQGTPYRHLQATKGRGADCTLFLGACFVEAGYLDRLEYEHYPKDWHLVTEDEFVLESIFRHFQNHLRPGLTIVEFPAQAAKVLRGDVITFATTKKNVSNHAGMVWGDGTMINSIGKHGVSFSKLNSWWMRHSTRLFRLCHAWGGA